MTQAVAFEASENAPLDPSIVRVGKDIVELVTSGMYLSPVTIYREYVQNSADSIDQAVVSGLIREGEGHASIDIDHTARSVRILDNGVGIRSKDAPSILLAIGGSTKRGTHARGFRGVGRLSGLAYCKNLKFRTRAAGENVVSVIEWDCKRLRQRLSDGSFGGDLHSVITDSVTYSTEQVADGDQAHFFEVTMQDVARHRGDILLNEAIIKDYLGQVAPVGFSEGFSFGPKVAEELAKHGIQVGVVSLHVQGDRVRRPYADRTVFPGNLFELTLSDIEFHEFADFDGETAAIGWIAHHQYARSIPPSLGIGRIRARIGDVQVGEAAVFDDVFKESRFNGWCVGEVHVIDRRVQPNARRDNFELNHHAYNLLAQLGPKAIKLSHRCRDTSVSRNLVITAKNLLQELDQGLANPEISRGTISRHLASIDRLLPRLPKIIDDAERKYLTENLADRRAKLAKHAVAEDDRVLNANETIALIRRHIGNNEITRPLIEALRSLSV